MNDKSLQSILQDLLTAREKAIATLEEINKDIAAINTAIGVAGRYVTKETDPPEATTDATLGLSPEIDIPVIRKEDDRDAPKQPISDLIMSAIWPGVSKEALVASVMAKRPDLNRRSITDSAYKLTAQGRLATDGKSYWLPTKAAEPITDSPAPASDAKPMLSDAVLSTLTNTPTLKHTLVKQVLARHPILKRESVISTIHKLARLGQIFKEDDYYCTVAFSRKPSKGEKSAPAPSVTSAPDEQEDVAEIHKDVSEPVPECSSKIQPVTHKAVLDEEIAVLVPRRRAPLSTDLVENLVFSVLNDYPRLEQTALVDKVVARQPGLQRSDVTSVIFSMIKNVKLRKISSPNFSSHIEAYLKPAVPA